MAHVSGYLRNLMPHVSGYLQNQNPSYAWSLQQRVAKMLFIQHIETGL